MVSGCVYREGWVPQFLEGLDIDRSRLHLIYAYIIYVPELTRRPGERLFGDFLEANEARLKDKHFLYVVSTNLREF